MQQWKSGRVLRLNITWSQAVKDYAYVIGVERTPTFILYDAQGEVLKRWIGKAPELDELSNQACACPPFCPKSHTAGSAYPATRHERTALVSRQTWLSDQPHGGQCPPYGVV